MDPPPPAGGEPPAAPPPIYTCPHCGEPFALAAAPADRVAECPACRTQFFVPSDDGDDTWRDDEETADQPPGAEEEAKRRESEFDNLRIKAIARERRGIIRTRSYVIIGLIGVVVIGAQFVWMA